MNLIWMFAPLLALACGAMAQAPAAEWYRAGHVTLQLTDAARDFSAEWQFDRADNGDNRRESASRIVEIGQAIGEPRPRMEQRRSGLPCHACIAIGRARHNTFKKAQDASHLRFAIKRCHEMHLGRTGIGKAHINAMSDERIA